MICDIVQNGGYMFLILCLYIILANSVIREHTLTVQEFCAGNLFMHNIEPGEPYVLTLKSENSSAVISKVYHKYYKRKCHQEFKTSDSAAHFEIFIANVNIPSCANCRCNYFEISAFGHSKRFCGHMKDDFFASKSDKLSIDFFPGLSMAFDVTLTFTVKRNFYIINGTPKEAFVPITFIETPYFPISYPPNYRVEYTLQSDRADIHVMLLFLDFLISHQSFIEVTGNNGSHSTRFYGNVFRPPAIVSQLSRLDLKFESNNQRDMPGFRAEVWFMKSVDPLFVPYTDCSGLKGGSDGKIHIKTQTHEGFSLYDCVWHIMPFMSANLNLSVFIQLREVGHKSYLEFGDGCYSKSEIVKKIDCENENCTYFNAQIAVPASNFLYIRFRGYLEVLSVVNMSYNTYHFGNCSNNEFRCSDGRCLLSDFRCDGIEQCPDGIDEDTCPSTDVLEDEVSLHPTVQTESYHTDAIHAKLFSVVLLGGLGLLFVGVAVLIFIYHRNQQTTAAGQLLPEQAVGGELSAVQPTLYTINSCDCDNPPSYEDFVKSSDNYPPPLYTRAKQRFIPDANHTQFTTSFCTRARVRHYSADSFNVRSCDTRNDIFLNISGDDSHLTLPSTSSNRYNIAINQNLTIQASKNAMKRTCSLDSKLNDHVNKDSCNFFLSVIHPVCAHVPNHHPHVQCQTLPPNFKMNPFKTSSYIGPKVNGPSCLQCDPSVSFSKERRFTWSFVPHGSEIVTIVKTRCFSDPCNGISVHCSLY